ncbi:hypothetical protein BEI02_16790 [Elizabethkingia sp. HvH-WGS333]|uniref:hypothetical protein n=1 Tax=Elizabethkingia TaxID=308865 RepID=UPI0007415E72|nr:MULTISPECIES: hypothetical protein [Elizabethkingia]KUG13993.1 hypothetical protein AMC91_01700 [Elizabethkingia miricola]MCL1658562.1 hypothetical protein [Elizabethkingia miricola]MCP1253763.1 hypothetical protein [Elizabethkingia sp. S0634]MDX8573551.1 hypothetical protein [Elizabethkingia sp. HX QKY]OIK45820.1 hypothetical protein BEI02_16790 [Elizabethkingia sp. HvH-WGS333]
MKKLLLTFSGLILLNSCLNREAEISQSPAISPSAISQANANVNNNDDILALGPQVKLNGVIYDMGYDDLSYATGFKDGFNIVQNYKKALFDRDPYLARVYTGLSIEKKFYKNKYGLDLRSEDKLNAEFGSIWSTDNWQYQFSLFKFMMTSGADFEIDMDQLAFSVFRDPGFNHYRETAFNVYINEKSDLESKKYKKGYWDAYEIGLWNGLNPYETK